MCGICGISCLLINVFFVIFSICKRVVVVAVVEFELAVAGLKLID